MNSDGGTNWEPQPGSNDPTVQKFSGFQTISQCRALRIKLCPCNTSPPPSRPPPPNRASPLFLSAPASTSSRQHPRVVCFLSKRHFRPDANADDTIREIGASPATHCFTGLIPSTRATVNQAPYSARVTVNQIHCSISVQSHHPKFNGANPQCIFSKRHWLWTEALRSIH